MVDWSALENVLVIADRGYEGYNLMAHIQEKEWSFLIRIQDVANSSGIAGGLDLPDTDEFDFSVNLSLTTKQSNTVKTLLENRNQYKLISATTTFDYLPKKNRKHQPAVFYNLPFRIVRFKITDDIYETVVTNLDKHSFPAEELKKLYNIAFFKRIFQSAHSSCPNCRKKSIQNSFLLGCSHFSYLLPWTLPLT